MFKTIKLNNGLEVKVDSEDFDELNEYQWGVLGKKYKYAARGTRKNGVYSKILMHRYIVDADKDFMVDHINGDTLDNRKQNLRVVTRAQNLQNSKKRADSKNRYKGVKKVRNGRYNARIQIAPNNRLFLGGFDNEEDAARAYDIAALKYFGENARLNFKKEDYE